MINNYLNKVIKYVCRIDINQLIQNLSTYEDEINSLNERLINSSDANNIKSEQIALLESRINSLNEQLTHSIILELPVRSGNEYHNLFLKYLTLIH